MRRDCSGGRSWRERFWWWIGDFAVVDQTYVVYGDITSVRRDIHSFKDNSNMSSLRCLRKLHYRMTPFAPVCLLLSMSRPQQYFLVLVNVETKINIESAGMYSVHVIKPRQTYVVVWDREIWRHKSCYSSLVSGRFYVDVVTGFVTKRVVIRRSGSWRVSWPSL